MLGGIFVLTSPRDAHVARRISQIYGSGMSPSRLFSQIFGIIFDRLNAGARFQRTTAPALYKNTKPAFNRCQRQEIHAGRGFQRFIDLQMTRDLSSSISCINRSLRIASSLSIITRNKGWDFCRNNESPSDRTCATHQLYFGNLRLQRGHILNRNLLLDANTFEQLRGRYPVTRQSVKRRLFAHNRFRNLQR